jgi:2',3'-cyclic-nucleotide 2'-phosphodiesterase (5'-nucleotidase family)
MSGTGAARRLALRIAALLTVLVVASIALPAGAAPRRTVDIQLLNVSDWHGQLDPLTINGQQVGGAAALATYFKQERALYGNTLTLTAGDAVGATPPISSFFADEPTIRVMRLMDFDVDALGNHNFDAGIERLQRQIDLARSPSWGEVPGESFIYLSSNLKNVDDNLSGVAPYHVFKLDNVKVAVIGVTNPEAPTLVFPGNFGTIEITDPVAAARKARAHAWAEGARIFIVITHMGVTQVDAATGQATGPLIDFANKLTGFDVILGDHTDLQYSGTHNGALVTENKSKGATYSKLIMTVNRSTGRVVSKSVQFVTPFVSAVTPDPEITALLSTYRTQLSPILSQLNGSSTVVIPRADSCGNTAGRICESLVGNVTTDALRTRYGVDFAVTNSGGLRADLTCPVVDNGADFCPPFTPTPYPITRGQVLGVLPFGNIAVTLSVSGAELRTILENGVSTMPAVNGRYPQVSGLCFTYDVSAPANSRVTGAVRQAADGSCTGAAVDLTAASTYTIAMNDFMATGGDGYPVLMSRATTRDILDQVLSDYVAASSPISPSIQGRIVCTSSGAVACPVRIP